MNKIFLINDYLTSKETLGQIIDVVSEEYSTKEIVVLDYTDYYQHHTTNQITYKRIIQYFTYELNSIVTKDDIVIAIGLSCHILVNFPNLQKIFINPFTFDNLSLKFSKELFDSYSKRKENEFENYISKLFNINDVFLLNEEIWFRQYYEKILKVTEILRNKEWKVDQKRTYQTIFKHSTIYISEYDEIFDSIISFKSLSKGFYKKTKPSLHILRSKKHLAF